MTHPRSAASIIHTDRHLKYVHDTKFNTSQITRYLKNDLIVQHNLIEHRLRLHAYLSRALQRFDDLLPDKFR